MAPGAPRGGEGPRPSFVNGSSGRPRTPIDRPPINPRARPRSSGRVRSGRGLVRRTPRFVPVLRLKPARGPRRGTRSSARAPRAPRIRRRPNRQPRSTKGPSPVSANRRTRCTRCPGRTCAGTPEPHTEPSLRERLRRRPWTPPAPRPSQPLPREGPRWSVPEQIRSTPANSGRLTPAKATHRSSSPTISSPADHEVRCTEEVHLPQLEDDLRKSHRASSGGVSLTHLNRGERRRRGASASRP